MKRLGIRSLARRKKYNFKKGSEHKIFPNILNRNFQSNKPFEKIATDITHLNYKGKKYYLACFLDLFNKEILEWNVQDKEDNYLILEPMKRLLKKKRMNTVSPLVLHSDQGSQYSSLSFTNLLEQYNVTQSMSRAGNPRDNAVMESFFGWFKHILKYDFNYYYANDLRKTIEKAIDFYNKERPSFALNYKTPVQYRIEQGFI